MSVCNFYTSELPNAIETNITSVPLLFIDTNGCDLCELETEDSESKGNEGNHYYSYIFIFKYFAYLHHYLAYLSLHCR